MNPHLYVKVGLLHGQDPRKADSWEVIGGLVGVSESREDFLPFRLKKTDPRYERVLLCPLGIEWDQKFLPATAAADADKTQQSKVSKAMKSIKNTVALFALAFIALAFATPVNAQSYNKVNLGTPGGTLNIAATSTNTTMSATNGMVVFCKGLTYAAFQPTFKLTGAGTSACVFTFDESVDGSVWVPGVFTISVTASGTTSVANLSNQTIGSVGYIRLAGITNPNANAMTNIYVTVSSKTNP